MSDPVGGACQCGHPSANHLLTTTECGRPGCPCTAYAAPVGSGEREATCDHGSHAGIRQRPLRKPETPEDREKLVAFGIDPTFWEIVPTHAEWVKTPTGRSGLIPGSYIRLREGAARLPATTSELQEKENRNDE